MTNNDLCRIPVSATFTVYKGSSNKPIMTKAEWADVPADVIAKFLIEKFGADAIFNGGEGDTP